jgi:RHS repeat-associated protein
MITSRTYDNIDRLKTINSTGITSGNYTASSTAYTYNSANQWIVAQMKDSATWNYGYDSLGQVNSSKKRFADGVWVPGEQWEYVQDDIGNRTSIKTGGDSTGASAALRTATYTPNSLNQYSSRTVGNIVDILGISKTSASVTVNGQSTFRKNEFYQATIPLVNNANQTVTVQATSGTSASLSGSLFLPPATENYAYDLDGNLTQDSRWNYTWDAENRLIRLTGRISGLQPTQIDYEYDWRGRRIKKVLTGTSTTTSKYIYDGWNLVAELDANNNLVRSFMWGLDFSGSLQGAGGVGGLIYTKLASDNLAHFCAYDGNGNVMALVSGGGTQSAEYEYTAFGETLRATGTMAFSPLNPLATNPFRFSTKYVDDDSDLIYYGYRYYNPGTGRWLSRDPIEEAGGANLFALAGNDGVNTADLLGLQCGDWWDPRTQLHRSMGFAAGVGEQAKGLWNLAFHLPSTLQGIGNAIANYDQTWDAIKNEASDAVHRYVLSKRGCIDPCLALEMEGKIASDVATMFIGVGELSSRTRTILPRRGALFFVQS